MTEKQKEQKPFKLHLDKILKIVPVGKKPSQPSFSIKDLKIRVGEGDADGKKETKINWQEPIIKMRPVGLAGLQSEQTVDRFVSQIGSNSTSMRQFVSDSLKVFKNASSKGVINPHKYVMVNSQNKQLYIFDMDKQKLWKSTYAALGSGGIDTVGGSKGTPDGLSFLNGPNVTGSRGGMYLSGAEKFNSNNDPYGTYSKGGNRTILFHDRRGPDGDLADKQRTTWGCIGVTSTILKQMMKDKSFYKAGVFVWTPDSRSQYLS